jgi:hypothetical protein
MSKGWKNRLAASGIRAVRRLAHLSAGIALATGLAFTTGCTSIPETSELSLLPATIKYDASRPIQVDVENKGGSVEVKVNPKLERPRVTCRVVDLKTGEPSKDEKARARQWISANLTSRAASMLLRVVNNRGALEGTGQFIWISIEIPTCNGVRIRNSAGGVTLKDVSGPIDVANGFGSGEGGPITVNTSQRLSDPVTLNTSEGPVILAMSGRSSGTIDLATANGPVEMRDRTAQITNVVQTAATWTGVLNDPSNAFKLRSGGGLVRVEINPDRAQR